MASFSAIVVISKGKRLATRGGSTRSSTVPQSKRDGNGGSSWKTTSSRRGTGSTAYGSC